MESVGTPWRRDMMPKWNPPPCSMWQWRRYINLIWINSLQVWYSLQPKLQNYSQHRTPRGLSRRQRRAPGRCCWPGSSASLGPDPESYHPRLRIRVKKRLYFRGTLGSLRSDRLQIRNRPLGKKNIVDTEISYPKHCRLHLINRVQILSYIENRNIVMAASGFQPLQVRTGSH